MAFALNRPGEREELVVEWDDGTFRTAEDVPTLIRYEDGMSPRSDMYQWGLQVHQDDQRLSPIHEWFKLRLYPPASDSELLRQYPSRAPPISETECQQLITACLRRMKTAFDSLKQRRGTALRNVPVEYIITVPAIWTDSAKDSMRRCAVRAGMGSDITNIQVIKEPEAAGIYLLHNMRNRDLHVGDTFVICDAGGGTVDLISYTVQSLQPITLIEAAQGTGGLCGGSFLNRAFESYLDSRFRFLPAFNSECKRDVMKYFEEKIKPSFPENGRRVWRVRVGGLPDNPGLGIVREHAEFSVMALKPIFDEVIQKVVKLVEAQIRATDKTVKYVLLAGGFGKSPHLRQSLEDAMNRNGWSTCIQPDHYSNTAIVRGALMWGLTRVNRRLLYARSTGRIPTRSYGLPQWVDFDPGKGHDPTKKWYDPHKKKDQIQVMNWFIKQGRLVIESDPPKIALCFRNDRDRFEPTDIPVYTHDTQRGERPIYPNDSLIQIVNLTAKLDRIASDNLRREDGGWIADFDVETTLNSANYLIFHMIVNGRRYDEDSVATSFA